MLEKCPTCGYSTAGLPVSKCPECGSNVPDILPSTAPHPALRILMCIGMTILTSGVAWFEVYVPDTPKPWAVMPFWVFLSILKYDAKGFLFFVAVACALTYPILRGSERISGLRFVFTYAMLVFAWFWMMSLSKYAIQYQGLTYFVTCVLAQAAFTGLILYAEKINEKRRDFASASVYQLIVSIWLASYAFPFMGGP